MFWFAFWSEFWSMRWENFVALVLKSDSLLETSNTVMRNSESKEILKATPVRKAEEIQMRFKKDKLGIYILKS